MADKVFCQPPSSQLNNVERANSSEVGEQDALPPSPTDLALPSSRKWFEKVVLPGIQIRQFLNLAVEARGDNNRTCSFGEWRKGGLNVAITLRFDDGLEWIVKMPKYVDETSQERLEGELGALIFLQKAGSMPTPRVHAYSITARNAIGTPYIMMDKISGMTLGEAVGGGLGRKGVYRTLEDLAEFRKTLQRRPFREIGSLYIYDQTDSGEGQSPAIQRPSETEYFVANLNSIWAVLLGPMQYRRYHGTDVTGYYFAQHRLSLSSEPIYGNPEERKEKNLVHLPFGLALPSYIIESSVFYLAHTDLSISNLLVDPSDGTLLGIIDWEFANTLPPQAVEHYPTFLGNRAAFVEHYKGFFDDPTAELEDWRAHYNKQFIDEPTISVFNDRIDLISNFEHLLRYPNERTLQRLLMRWKHYNL